MTDQATALRRAMERARSHAPAVEPLTNGEGGEENEPQMSADLRHRRSRHDGPSTSAVCCDSPTAATAAPPRANQPKPKLAKAIAISSGKGGVGKSNIAVNMAVALSRLGLKTCLLDADMGLANADVLCNLTPKQTLEHVVAGKCKLWEAMMFAPGGFRLIPGASGVSRMAELGQEERRRVLQQLAALERVADVLIIDTGAGISSMVMTFAAAAHTTVVVTTPEPTALTDAYGMIKTLFSRAPDARVEVLVNMCESLEEAESVFGRMDRVCRTFLRHRVHFGGAVPADSTVRMAVRQRVPFVLLAPEAPATLAVRNLARRMVGLQDESLPNEAPGTGFFARVSKWLGRSER